MPASAARTVCSIFIASSTTSARAGGDLLALGDEHLHDLAGHRRDEPARRRPRRACSGKRGCSTSAISAPSAST